MQTTVFWTIHWNLLKPLYKFEFLDPTLHEKKGRGRPRGRPERDVSAKFVPETSSSSPSKSLGKYFW
jgi:hypothetical protein